MKLENHWQGALGGLLVLLLAGCATPGRSAVTFHDPNMDFSLVRSAAVMPFANLTPVTNAGERVRTVFMTMLQATGGVYVLPPGEVGRGISKGAIGSASAPAPEDVVKLGQMLKVDAVITGSVLEYGELRSGTTGANVISVSVQMLETQTGKVVWSASSTQGGVTAADRLFGGGGQPMETVTEQAVRDLIDKLFAR